MTCSQKQLCQRVQKHDSAFPEPGLALDISGMNFAEDFFPSMEAKFQKAFSEMAALGIRGPALGPQFVAQASGDPTIDKILSYFLDETDLYNSDNTLSISTSWFRHTFPKWDWGLLSAVLQRLDIDGIVDWARTSDRLSPRRTVTADPAGDMAFAVCCIDKDKVDKNIIPLPYRDCLDLFSKCLLQLVTELLGNVGHQKIKALVNKGFTHQHSYVQQLREGFEDFVAALIEVFGERSRPSIEVDLEVTTEGHLKGFLLATRSAPDRIDKNRVTLTPEKVSPLSVGLLIGLFERVVGPLIKGNPNHQASVEGLTRAAVVSGLQPKLMKLLSYPGYKWRVGGEIAARIDSRGQAEPVLESFEHLQTKVRLRKIAGAVPRETKYQWN